MKLRLLILAAGLVLAASAQADEGMWQPAQLPGIAAQLKARGLELDPSRLTDLTGPTMGAVVSLGFCTASFVSPQGLIVTNHHCAYGSIQYNSSAERNLVKQGFLAHSLAEELPGDPTLRVYVTEEIRDVTREVRAGLSDGMSGYDRYMAVDKAQKAIVKQCEKPGGVRCDVKSFHGGWSYQLVKQREIKDVRLVYAPPDSIGKYGGDVDNWMWPRHTGDFSFLRAYVAKDGRSATYSKDNVPFQPKHHLPLNPVGVAAGDYVMVTGYPGRTNRYRLAGELKDAIEWSYPTRIGLYTDLLDVIDSAGAADPAVKVKYLSVAASLRNGLKNFKGQLEGLAKADGVRVKRAREAELKAWLEAQGAQRANLVAAVDALEQQIDAERATRDRDLILGQFDRVGVLNAARIVYRLSLEHEKADAQREAGYQERDEPRLEGALKQLERRMDLRVDRALFALLLKRYVALPADQHVAALDAWLDGAKDAAAIEARLDALYAHTKLGDTAQRLTWFKARRAQIEASDDAVLKLAVALTPDLLKIERVEKEHTGTQMLLRPRYMEAMIAFNATQGRAVYPDANGSLRVTYGQVQGFARDGVQFLPFTTVDGVIAKTTNEEPFDPPQAERAAVAAKDFGAYAAPSLRTVPVDFLADLDITGGNSGSPTLDGQGRLVGLAFDGNWDSVSADWIFDPKLTRSIQVDVRYMLWVMDKIDHAGNLLREMGVSAQ